MSKRSRKIYEAQGDDALASVSPESKSKEDIELSPEIQALYLQLRSIRSDKHELFRLKALSLERRRMERVRLLKQLHRLRLQQVSIQYMSELKASLLEYSERKEALKDFFKELTGQKRRKIESIMTRSKASGSVKGPIKSFKAFRPLFVLSNAEVSADLESLKEKVSESELAQHDYAIKRSLIESGPD